MNALRSLAVRLPESVRRRLNLDFALPGSAGPVRLPLLAGITAPPPPRRKTWKADLIERLLPLREGAFVDCGVNLGQTLVEFRSVSDRPYIGFEPNPECVHYVRHLIAANQWSDTTIVGAGVSDSPKVAVLYQRPGATTDPAGTITQDERPRWKGEATAAVPLLRLDDALTGLGHHAAVLKIDVEGHEAAALRGMTGTLRQDRPTILCEVLPGSQGTDLSSAAARHREILDALRSVDYVLLHLARPSAESRVEGAAEQDDFVREHFKRERMHLYDYVFAPSEGADQVIRALEGVTHSPPVSG